MFCIISQKKRKVGIEKQESCSDARLQDGTADMEGGQRSRGVPSLCCYKDSLEVANHLWDHPLCFVFRNPFLSLSLNLQTYQTVCTGVQFFLLTQNFEVLHELEPQLCQLVTSYVVLGKLLVLPDSQLYDKSYGGNKNNLPHRINETSMSKFI